MQRWTVIRVHGAVSIENVPTIELDLHALERRDTKWSEVRRVISRCRQRSEQLDRLSTSGPPHGARHWIQHNYLTQFVDILSV